MASIDFKTGQIKDRAKGYRALSYCVPRASKSFMKKCLKAHELVISMIDGRDRAGLASHEMKSLVLKYAALDSEGKRELIKRLILKSDEEKKPREASLEAIALEWMESKNAEGSTEKSKKTARHRKDLISMFFSMNGLRTTSDLGYGTASEYLKWRSGRNGKNRNRQVSASTLQHELQTLRRIARLACKNGYIPNGNLWDDVKVKAIPGVNRKVVEPLSIDAQKELLLKLKGTPCHDIALMLLVTGMRIGELETLKPDGAKNGVLALHGEGVGTFKPSGGKTASSFRTLPACPTMLKLLERGNIFKTSRNAFSLELSRHFKGIHPHRLRHTFAVNKLLAQTPLQMVSYQMGHSKTDITADLYGKFVPEHFKAGFEETIRIRKEHLDWLENRYEF